MNYDQWDILLKAWDFRAAHRGISDVADLQAVPIAFSRSRSVREDSY